ncbi:uncharacterized protein B0I36DRAFT_363679 [Microdochium trichocladiopsis]|uniref:Hydrophobin n=1 Tax=Microdochium trichocladiopsis TaxID=1682393 RepID=A0A9P8Y4A0_9PEZI|nr:uncharacterized protein B0I36DRAFT_363679 [Microdochium trichocladiopsis]KAH7029090.1 hypothetical protein B0I36DRAFT_363679 [Microdochium trichocladiopsis]
MLPRPAPSNLLLLLLSASPLTSTSPTPKPQPEPGRVGDLLGTVVKLVGKLPLNKPPPDILWTPNPSPQCAAVNGGELTCCQATLAGDLPLLVYLAETYGYELNPNDVNGIYCGVLPVSSCPGVKLCCQVTALNPLLSLFCQDPPL